MRPWSPSVTSTRFRSLIDGSHVDHLEEELGDRIVAILGPGAARDLLGALERPEADRAELIARLTLREGTGWLAELLTEVEALSARSASPIFTFGKSISPLARCT